MKTKAKNLEASAIASMKALGIPLEEIPRWNCCGGVYSLADDDLIHQVAPVRNLVRVKEQGKEAVVTLCSFCFNSLKRANLLVKNNAEKRDALNSFMDEEIDYNGQVKVLHLLEILRDKIGWRVLSEKVKVPLKGLKLAPYYGCTLLRPKEVAIDDVERPSILQGLLQTLGAEVIDFPYSMRCCGSYQRVARPDSISRLAGDIVSSAAGQGAEALVLTCPLCDFNLGWGQKRLMEKDCSFRVIPIFYFTQLLALALGVEPTVCHLELNWGNPETLLESKGLLPLTQEVQTT